MRQKELSTLTVSLNVLHFENCTLLRVYCAHGSDARLSTFSSEPEQHSAKSRSIGGDSAASFCGWCERRAERLLSTPSKVQVHHFPTYVPLRAVRSIFFSKTSKNIIDWNVRQLRALVVERRLMSHLFQDTLFNAMDVEFLKCCRIYFSEVSNYNRLREMATSISCFRFSLTSCGVWLPETLPM